MSNNDEYTPDFEVPSENDTSQVVSVQSEILDEAEGTGNSSSEKSPPFSSTSPKRPKTQEESSQEDDDEPTPRHESKELEEIEDIIRKLERLEKAQNLLEDALHLSDAEPDLPDISEKSERTERSYATSRSSYRSERVHSRPSKSKSSVSAENSLDLENDVELSQAIQTGMDSIRQIIEQDLSSQTKNDSQKSVSSSRSSRRARVVSNIKGPKIIDGSGDHSEKGKVEAETVRLKNELARQEALIAAYQKENEKLYGQLKNLQEEMQGKEGSHETEVKDLKTEIATLKLNRLVSLPTSSGTNSPRLGSAHKGELDRLNEELTVKSLMIVELRKEIALLKVEKESRPSSGRLKGKTPPLSIDKEKDYQDRIKALQKQVRTLQRILYNKESTAGPPAGPSISTGNLSRGGASSARASLASRGRAMSLGKFDVSKKAISTPNIDVEALEKLEAQLERERTEFQRRLAEKQKVIEDNEVQIQTLKVELSKIPQEHADGASETESAILEQLQNRLLNQSDIIQTLKEQVNSLKGIESERNAYKREVAQYEARVKELQRKLTRAETLAKPSFRGSSGSKEVQKPSMNQEKEKEYQKQVTNLQRQVRTLQKILYTKNPAAADLLATSGSKEDLRANVTSTRPKSLGPFKKPANPPNPAPKSNYSAQMLQSTFEQERLEFEKLLTQKQMQLEEKDRQIRELRAKLSATIEENAWIAHESTSEKAAFEEFRGKLAAQNKIIDSLKSRLASFANVEAERTMLKREIHHLEFRVQDLQRKLARAESLARPESEVLATLSEKVEDLHTRYYYRERQLDTLLDRLSMKTGQSFGSPRTLHSYGNANNACSNGNSSDFGPGNHHSASSARSNNIDLGELSPSATLHLIPHRDIPEI